MTHIGYWLKGAVYHFSDGKIFATDWHSYDAYLGKVALSGNPWIIKLRAGLSGIAGLVSGLYIGWKMAEPRDALIYLTGRHFYDGKEAIKRAEAECRIERDVSGDGILLHPEIRMSLDRESRHILIMGSVGSGKTQTLWHLLNQVIERGDRAIIYDNKGEFTSGIKKRALFAPWDARSFAWDIGRDCLDRHDAREFAARWIQENEKDPMWSNASRAILTGLIVYLQVQHGMQWGFRELADLIPEPLNRIAGIIAIHNPEGLRSVEEASKTTQGILINLSSSMSVIFDLAKAWGDVPSERRISLRKWLANKTKNKVLVLQGAANSADLTKAYVNAMISVVSAQVGSPSYPNNSGRRIWVFLDELPQIGKIEHLGPLLEIGRSKGVRVVIGTQNVSQLQEIYGDKRVEAWTSMIGTSIYGKMAGGASANWVSQRIGSKVVERPNHVISSNQGGYGSSISYTRESIPLITPEHLQSKLGVINNHVRMLVDGFRDGVYQVDYPFAEVQEYRATHVPVNTGKTAQSGKSHNPHDVSGDGGGGREATATAAPTPANTDPQKRKFIKRETGQGLQPGDVE
jgi:hypothetical protein